MKKTYVLDTNVILHSAQSLNAFEDNEVVIPMTVIEELDKFKRNQDELGRTSCSSLSPSASTTVSPTLSRVVKRKLTS